MKNSQKGFVIPLLITIIALLVLGGGAYIYLNQPSNTSITNQDKHNIGTTSSSSLNTQTTSSINSEISIYTWSGGDFTTSGIWKTADNNGKKWIINYQNAIYSESYIDENGKTQPQSPDRYIYKDIFSWLNAAKSIGQNIEGSVNVIGVIDANGVLQASKIIRHDQ